MVCIHFASLIKASLTAVFLNVIEPVSWFSGLPLLLVSLLFFYPSVFLFHDVGWYFIFFFLFAELLGDVLKDQPQEADGIDSVIVVDNVPQVGPDRLEKLKNVIHKIFSKFGKIINEFYPEADGKTKG